MNSKLKNLDYLQRFIDLWIVFSSWILAFYMKFEWDLLGQSESVSFERYMGYGILLAIVSVIAFKNSRLYGDFNNNSIVKTLVRQLKANTVAFIVFMVLAFFSSSERISRVHLVAYVSISTILLIISKIIFHNLMTKLSNNFVFIGHGKVIRDYYENLMKNGKANILYWIDAPDDVSNINKVDSVD